MSKVCSGCAEVIQSVQDELTCGGGCSRIFHFYCLGFTEGAFRKLSEEKKKRFRCNVCTFATTDVSDEREKRNKGLAETGRPMEHGVRQSDSAKSSSCNSDLLCEISLMLEQKFDLKLGPLTKEISELRNLVTFVGDKFDEWLPRINEIENHYVETRKELTRVREENNLLRKEMKSLKGECLDIQIHSMSSDLEIRGLLVKDDKDAEQAVRKIADLLEMDDIKQDLENVQLRRLKNNQQLTLVKLKSKQVRDKWLVAVRKRRGIKLSEINDELPNTPVFLNECLPVYLKTLLFKVKQVKNENKLHSFWVRDGKIYLKKTADSVPKRIREEEDLINV